MKTKKPFELKAIATAIALANVSIVYGAVAEESTPAGLIEEIIVTATRRETSVQDVPYNISAISGADLEAAQIIDNADLMREIPGVAVVDRGYRNSGVINGVTIRGLNVDGSALGDYSLSAVPTVSTYIGDTPLYANFILKDLQRVEVLRGPQGTLYGSGSLGGTVRYIPNTPVLDSFEGDVALTATQTQGSGGMGWNADLLVNIPLSQIVALRASYGKIDYDGITDYVNLYQLDANGVPLAPSGILSTDAAYETTKDADDVDIWYAKAALLVEPNDRARFLLSYQTQSDDIGGRRQQTVGQDGFGQTYDKKENGSIQREPSSREVNLASLEIELDLGFATLTSSSSYYEHEGDSISENTGFYAQNGWLGAFYYNYPRPLARASRTYGDEAFTQEIRLVSNTDGKVDYVAGFYYRNQDLSSTQQSFLVGFKAWWDTADIFGDLDFIVSGDQDFDYSRDEKFKETAFFGEITWHLNDDVRLVGGLRYFDNKITNNTLLDLPLYAGVFQPSLSSFEAKEDDVLFKINASWDISDSYMLYGTISEGYRRGGTNAVPTSGNFAEDPGWLNYDSDSVTNYEIGIKGQTSTMQFTIAAFYVDWHDIQINTATTNWGFFSAANAGAATTKGIEIEVDGYLNENWHYGFGYAFVDAELDDDYFAPDNSVTPRALAGAQLPGTAKHTINASLDYTRELNNGIRWTSRLSAYYQASTRNAINDTPTFNVALGDFQLWNASTTFSNDGWSATLFVRNIFNEEGVTGLFTEAFMGTSPVQNYYGNGNKEFISVPRVIGGSLRYRF